MPLRALRPDSKSVLAFDQDADGWFALKQQLRTQGYPWRLGCCGAPAVPKTSPRGTAFFAHKAGAPDCLAAGETEHHRALKAIAVAAARAAGWAADTEVAGADPEGNAWVADVLATRGEARVAVEVQWSRIGIEELLARQRRYSAAGVRCLWLIRGNRLPSAYELPAFGVRQLDDGAYTLRLPHHDPMRWEADDPHAEVRDRPAQAALEAAFSGRLRWGFRAGEPVAYSVVAAEQTCWKCQAPTAIVTSFRVNACGTRLELGLDALEQAGDLVQELLPADARRERNIGEIRRRFSRTAGEAYLSNGCVRCDALQGRHFEYQATGPEHVVYRAMSSLDSRWLAAFEEHDEPHWRLLEPPSVP